MLRHDEFVRSGLAVWISAGAPGTITIRLDGRAALRHPPHAPSECLPPAKGGARYGHIARSVHPRRLIRECNATACRGYPIAMLKPTVEVRIEGGVLVAEFWDCLRLDPTPVME